MRLIQKKLQKSYYHSTFFSPFIISLIIAILSAGFFVSVTYYIDNTTVPTANGLYKARVLTEHLAGRRAFLPQHSFYINHAAYADVIVGIWRVLGITAWPGTVLTKIAVVNSLAAGAILGLVWYVSWHITKKQYITTLITVTYAFSGYFFFLSISSEDIMPALAMVSAAVVSFFFFTESKRWYLLAAAGGFLGIAVLLHRTVIIGYPAFIAALLVDAIRRRHSLFQILQILAIFTIAGIVPVVLVSANPAAIFFASPDVSGWTGFVPAKLLFTFVAGIGQSILYGKNLTNINAIIQPENILPQIVTLVFVTVLIYILFGEIYKRERFAVLSVFLLSNFAASEITNLYAQGQDPQFQMQPLFLLPLACAIVYVHARRSRQAVIRMVLLLLFIVVIITNGTKALLLRGKDTQYLNSLAMISQRVNRENTIFVTFGFDDFFTWGQFAWDVTEPNSQFVSLTSFPVRFPQLSVPETSNAFLDELKQKEKDGKHIITTDILLLSDNAFAEKFSSIAAGDKALAMKRAFFAQYELEPFLYTDMFGMLYRTIPRTTQ